jgi:hypothetical protein
VQYVEN